MSPAVVLRHTGQLEAAGLGDARRLLEEAFEGGFDDHDWEHCLGGVHALVSEGGRLVGHAALVQRRLLHQGRALRAGYVEGVGVRARSRGRGHGALLMSALEQLAGRAYEVAALSSSAEAAAFYRARGWQQWGGPTSMMTPAGVVRTEQEDDSVHVLPLSAQLDLEGPLTCDWRDGDVW